MGAWMFHAQSLFKGRSEFVRLLIFPYFRQRVLIDIAEHIVLDLIGFILKPILHGFAGLQTNIRHHAR